MMFSNLDRSTSYSIPRWLFSMIFLVYVSSCILGFIFIVPLPYNRYTQSKCTTVDIDLIDVANTTYSSNLHVWFLSSATLPPTRHNATIHDACQRTTSEERDNCLNSYSGSGSFACYYRDESTTKSNNSTEQYLVKTKDQIWSEYMDGMKSAVRVESISLSVLCIVLVVIFIVIIIRRRWTAKEFAIRFGEMLVSQPVSSNEDDLFFFDESESHSVASFISTESATNSFRKRRCHALLSFSIKRETRSPNDSMIRERVLWYYNPKGYDVLKSVEAGQTFIVLTALTFLSILAWFSFVIFGLLMASAHLVAFVAHLLIPVPMILIYLLMNAYGTVFRSHYYLTDYRAIVLVELPFRFGYVVYSKLFVSLRSVKVHQFYSNVIQSQGFRGDNISNEPELTITDNESLLLDLGDDYEGSVAVLPMRTSQQDYTPIFHFVRNVDSIVEWIRRKIMMDQNALQEQRERILAQQEEARDTATSELDEYQ